MKPRLTKVNLIGLWVIDFSNGKDGYAWGGVLKFFDSFQQARAYLWGYDLRNSGKRGK